MGSLESLPSPFLYLVFLQPALSADLGLFDFLSQALDNVNVPTQRMSFREVRKP